jgi:hypothetical protein
LGDVERFVHPHNFKFSKQAAHEGVHLTLENMDQKREEFFADKGGAQAQAGLTEKVYKRRPRRRRADGEVRKMLTKKA